MVRLAADENLNGDIVRGLLIRRPDLDVVRVQDAGLEGADDPTVLAWAAANDRVLLTHDRATMPDFAYDRVTTGEPMPGLIVVNDRLPVRQVIDDVVLITEVSAQAEWVGRVLYLPL